MSRTSPVALAALMAPVATRASVLATALLASFVDRLEAHCRAFSSARRPASVILIRATSILREPATTRSTVAACHKCIACHNAYCQGCKNVHLL
jgi:hypothetical protein